jgi:hypothetical protein
MPWFFFCGYLISVAFTPHSFALALSIRVGSQWRDSNSQTPVLQKGMSRNIFLPPPEARMFFRDIQPSDHRRRSPGVVPWVVLFHISEFFWVATTISEFFWVATTRDGF